MSPSGRSCRTRPFANSGQYSLTQVENESLVMGAAWLPRRNLSWLPAGHFRQRPELDTVIADGSRNVTQRQSRFQLQAIFGCYSMIVVNDECSQRGQALQVCNSAAFQLRALEV